MDEEYKELKRVLIRQSKSKVYKLGLEDILESLNNGYKLEELDLDDIKFLFKMFCGQILETEPHEEIQVEILDVYNSVKRAEISDRNKSWVLYYFKMVLLPMWRGIK